MSTPLRELRSLDAPVTTLVQDRSRGSGRRVASLVRFVLRDRRAAAITVTWYAALVLGWQPGLPGAISMIVFAPLWLVLGLLGLFFLPGNLLVNLRLTIPEPFQLAYAGLYLLCVAGLHAWLYFAWRWPVLVLVALVLCASSYGCQERMPSFQ